MTDVQASPVAGGDPPLWPWSLETYGRAGFSAAAVGLQDGHGLDVNVLLYCLWAGLVHRVSLGTVGVRRVLAATGEWQREVVLPLRAVRRVLKDRDHPDPPFIAALRSRVAADEIEAERGEQALLAALPLPAAGCGEPVAAAAANLRCYRAVAGLDAGPGVDGLLGRLLALAAGLDDGLAGRLLAGDS
jgi:uncharacterized protein (TIGR02444 family)